MQPPYGREDVRFYDKLDLAALRTAVTCSRLFTKFVLYRWRAPFLIDDACLLVSELVTNAVKVTGNVDEHPTWSALSDLKLISVRLVGLEASIVFEVWDTSDDAPVLTDASLEAEGGRGLYVIDHVAKRWGYYPVQIGKVVWAELPVYPNTEHEPPKRQRPSDTPPV